MIAHNKLSLGVEEEAAALRVLHSGWLAQGQEVAAFEREFCEFLGLPDGHALAVSSGTSALFLALWALNASGKTVAFPVYTCSSLRHAVVMAGASEKLVDIASGTPNIDARRIAEAFADLAIVPHMFGLPVNLSNIESSADNVIEDCAQSLGSSIDGVHSGLQGDIGVFSFYATKLMTSGGQGGMVVSTDPGHIARIRDYREFDQRRDRKARFNFQLTDLSAAIGREQLKKLPGFLLRRAEIYDRYRDAGLPLLDVDRQSKHTIKPVRYRAIVTTESPRTAIEHLERNGVRAIVPIEDWELLGSPGAFPNASNMSKTTISLPIYPDLTDLEVTSIIRVAQSVLL